MFLHGRVFAVAARAQVRGDPLALGEYLDGAAGEPDLDLGAGKAMRHAVIMLVDIDVVIDPDAAGAPFGEHVRLGRQGLERRPVEFFEELAPRHAETPDRALVVQPHSVTLVMASFNSPKLWNRRLRRRPRIQRSMISTPTSTLALSRGLRGLAGSTPVP